MTTLSDFPSTAPCPLIHAVPLDAMRPVLTNFQLVREMVKEAFQKDPGVVLFLDSNGNIDRPATEFYLRRWVR